MDMILDPNQTPSDFLDKLKVRLKCKTDSRLAMKVGVQRSTISKWRSETKRPAVSTMVRIGNMVGLPEWEMKLLLVVWEQKAALSGAIGHDVEVDTIDYDLDDDNFKVSFSSVAKKLFLVPLFCIGTFMGHVDAHANTLENNDLEPSASHKEYTLCALYRGAHRWLNHVRLRFFNLDIARAL